MDLINNNNVIEEGRLDRNNYFQSLIREAIHLNILNKSETEKIQLALAELLGKQVERYTNGESSSVRVEKAQSLLSSICYSLSIYLKSAADMETKLSKLKNERLEALFRNGIDVIMAKLKEYKECLEVLQKNSLQINNLAYHDTIFKGLPDFFHDYEPEFAAQEGAGSIDYPLCIDIMDLNGIEYIMRYLDQLTEENNFCLRFPQDRIEQLLQGFSPASVHILVNVYELVLTNALACEILGKDIYGLSVSAEDRERLQRILAVPKEEALINKLGEAYKSLCKTISYEETVNNYAYSCIRQIAQRLKYNLKTETLDKIFITAADENNHDAANQDNNDGEENFFIEGQMLEDERLRDIIEDIKECRLISDKIAIIKNEVRSIRDMLEIIKDCFYGDEYDRVYGLFNDVELKFLVNLIKEEMNELYIDEDIRMEAWQEKLFDYYERHKVNN